MNGPHAMAQPKVAIVHPRLAFGGSEAVALWAVESLKDRFDVTLITGGPVDLERLNEYYGTRIAAAEIRILRAPIPVGLQDTARFSGLRGAFFQRYCREVAPKFDLMINTYGPSDFGVQGIQCIADFAFVQEWRNTLHPELASYRRWWYGDSPLRHAYLGLCLAIYRQDSGVWRRNLTLANSHWTARLLEEKFGVQSQVVYPPVPSNCADVPWEQRESGFVCVGRVVPEKRVDTTVAILSRVRRQGHDVHVHILGGVDDSPFGRKVKQLAAENSDWVFLEGWVAGRRKHEMIAAHRFGIHGRVNEPFGIAVAEMIKAGCVTFVHDSGGQTEIVNDAALRFKSEEDAVQKIDAVLSNRALEDGLRRQIAESARRFSVQAFVDSIREVVESRVAKRAS